MGSSCKPRSRAAARATPSWPRPPSTTKRSGSSQSMRSVSTASAAESWVGGGWRYAVEGNVGGGRVDEGGGEGDVEVDGGGGVEGDASAMRPRRNLLASTSYIAA